MLVERMSDIWRVLCLGMVSRLATYYFICSSQHFLEGGLVIVPLYTEEENRGFLKFHMDILYIHTQP